LFSGSISFRYNRKYNPIGIRTIVYDLGHLEGPGGAYNEQHHDYRQTGHVVKRLKNPASID
jgi:hypothetical protein